MHKSIRINYISMIVDLYLNHLGCDIDHIAWILKNFYGIDHYKAEGMLWDAQKIIDHKLGED